MLDAADDDDNSGDNDSDDDNALAFFSCSVTII